MLLAAPAYAAKPNIIFILADDLNYERGDWNHYPALKALAAQGLTFRNHFVTNALCCPSRASILRGQYSHNTGIFTNAGVDGGFKRFRALGRENSTVATWLRAAGYRTAMMGKYLNGYKAATPQPPGWTTWAAGGAAYAQYNYDLNVNGHVEHHGNAPSDYLQDVLTAKALDFIAGPEPFFLYLASYSPHSPTPHAPRHDNTFPGANAPRGPTYNEPDVSHQPPWLKAQQLMGPDEIAQTDIRYRLRLQAMLAVDDTIGALTAALATAGKLDNTHMFFTSDNGFHLGQHRLANGKETQFDEDLHVPLLVRGPGVPAGHAVDAMTVNMDFAPTFAQLANATTPAFVDGRSLVPLLNGVPPTGGWRKVFLLEHRLGPIESIALDEDLAADIDPTPSAYTQERQPSFVGVRTTRYSYARMDGQTALYDIILDPYQHINVAATKPAQRNRLDHLTTALVNCAGQSCRTIETNEAP